MKKKMMFFVLFVLLSCAFFCAVQTYRWGFWPTKPPKRDFQSADMLLTLEDLSSSGSWVMVSDIAGGYNGLMVERAWEREFTNAESRLYIYNVVSRYDNGQHARGELRMYKQLAFEPGEISADFFQPRYADEWYLRCESYNNKGFGCEYEVTYEEFDILLTLNGKNPISPNEYEFFSELCRILDERAHDLLSRKGR